MVFYKQLNKKNNYFAFSGLAHLPTNNIPAQPNQEKDGWGVVENLGNGEANFEELQELRDTLKKEK